MGGLTQPEWSIHGMICSPIHGLQYWLFIELWFKNASLYTSMSTDPLPCFRRWEGGRTCRTRWTRSCPPRIPSLPWSSTSQGWTPMMPSPPFLMRKGLHFCGILKTQVSYRSFVNHNAFLKVPQECRPFLIWVDGEGIVGVQPCEVDKKGGEGILGGHDIVHLVWQVLSPSHRLKQDN